jgi:aryl-alcohol dehydrogenase-like predicted oxidoreductase
MIDTWGGWDLLQELLTTLDVVATQHEASIANVAVRFVLDHPAVAGVIVGARLGVAEHLKDNVRVFDIYLNEEERERIQAVASKGNDLFAIIGDCGDEYRRLIT